MAKFNVGDVLVHRNDPIETRKVSEVLRKTYKVTTQSGVILNLGQDYIEHVYRLKTPALMENE